MNVKLIIIGCVFVILMVMFGNNPVEEARKEREKKKAGLDDPLVEAISEYNKENPFGHGSSLFNEQRRDLPPVQQAPSYMYYKQRTPSRSRTAEQPQEQRPGNNNSYYPPPPVRDDSRGLTPGMPRSEAPHSNPSMYLRNGQALAYEGTNVFFYDRNGRLKPLPDGHYQLENGIGLFVQGGRQIVASN